MQVPTFDTFTSGEKVTAAKLNKNMRDAGNYFRQKPVTRISSNAAQTFATGTALVAVTFNAVDVDTDNAADIANNRIVVVTPGLYRVIASVAFSPNATGGRRATVILNGSATYVADDTAVCVTSAFAAVPKAGRIVRLAAGDVLTVSAAQNSGASLATVPTYGGVSLEIEWIGA